MESTLADQLHKIKSFFLCNYGPSQHSQSEETGTKYLSTEELHIELFSLFPSQGLTPEIVFNWLANGGFKLFDSYGNVKFKWGIIPKNTSCMNKGYEFPKVKNNEEEAS